MLVGVGFATISMFLPFATLPVIGSLNGVASDAWPALVALGPALIAAVFGDWSRGSSPLVGSVALVLAASGLVFAVAKLADAILAVRGVTGAALGSGAAVLVGGCAVAAAGSALAFRHR